MVTGWNSRPCATQEPSLNLDIFSSFHLEQADTRASCALRSIFLAITRTRSNKRICRCFFFCTLILNATIDFKHAALHTRLLRNWHENQPRHHVRRKNSRLAVRAESERGTRETVGAVHLGTTSPRAAAAAASTSVFGCDWLSESESTEIRDSGFTSTRTSARPDPAVQEDPSQAPVGGQAPAVPLVNVRYHPVGRLYHLN